MPAIEAMNDVVVEAPPGSADHQHAVDGPSDANN